MDATLTTDPAERDRPRAVPSAEWMTPGELADWLRLPVATLYQWRHRGIGPRASKIGRHLRYRRTDVEAWLAEQGSAA